MSDFLVFTVRYLRGRYHGAGPWPPSPARLFQALVAGCAKGTQIAGHDKEALEWLERLPPPQIAAPKAARGTSVGTYVPNNDLDAVGGDPARIGKIRTLKTSQPHLFDENIPLRYCWGLSDDNSFMDSVNSLSSITEKLYQLGRGEDTAFAEAEILSEADLNARLSNDVVTRYAPSFSTGAMMLDCPVVGSLKSLRQRFAAGRERFKTTKVGRKVSTEFTRPPRAAFRTVSYNAPPGRLLFDLKRTGEEPRHSWPLTDVVALTEAIRDGIIDQFKRGLKQDPTTFGSGVDSEAIDRFVKGAKGAPASELAKRIRIIPLPSIGHKETDPAIRRVLIEVPHDSPLSMETMRWAASGLPLTPDHDPETGEVWDHIALEAAALNEDKIAPEYKIARDRKSSVWQTITPAALSDTTRRRMEPGSQSEQPKGSQERLAEEALAIEQVRKSLKHAGIYSPTVRVGVQREPWTRKGEMAGAFGENTRFNKHSLWHVELELETPVPGPFVLGDGRFLGLGLMRPVADGADMFAFEIDPKTAPPVSARSQFLRAARRAIMGRAKDKKGNILTLFSGHERDKGPARSGQHRHIFLAAFETDGRLSHLYVMAPWLCDRSYKPDEARGRANRGQLQRVVNDLTIVRAGRLGVIGLRRKHGANDGAGIFVQSRVWRTHTAYIPTRYPKTPDPDHLIADLRTECLRRELPRPSKVRIMEMLEGPRGAVSAHMELTFAQAVKGPLLLGRDSHSGAGLFVAV